MKIEIEGQDAIQATEELLKIEGIEGSYETIDEVERGEPEEGQILEATKRIPLNVRVGESVWLQEQLPIFGNFFSFDVGILNKILVF